MPTPKLIGRTVLVELFARVLPQRLEHLVPRGVVGPGLHHEHRLRDETGQRVDDVPGLEVVTTHHRGRGRRVEGPGEDAEAVEHQPVHRVQEPVRPVDRGPQRAVALDGGSAPAGEEPESLVEQPGDLGRRHGDDPRGRQLDRERDAVESPAHLGHGLRVRCVDDEAGSGSFRTLAEQAARVTRLDRHR